MRGIQVFGVLTLAVGALLVTLEADAIEGLRSRIDRQEQRIAVLSEELYGIPDPLKAVGHPREHENRLEDIEQRLEDVAGGTK
jgi:tetrahydromethanopterin S-methyltransferase subunit G